VAKQQIVLEIVVGIVVEIVVEIVVGMNVSSVAHTPFIPTTIYNTIANITDGLDIGIIGCN
jgi:hypothetical protein